MLPLMIALIPVTLAADEMSIGFVNHFPMVDHEDETIPLTGANVIMVRAPWPFIEPEEDVFEFGILDQQLELAERADLKLVFIMESGPAHAAGIPWLIDKLQAEGGTQVDLAGTQLRDPSIFSATYREHLERYLTKTVGYLANHPLSHRIYGYSNGCEWWYPLSRSYSPLAAGAFSESLQSRHDTVDSLNERWGTGFASWDDVAPPRLSFFGASELSQSYLLPAGHSIDACYCTTEQAHIPMEPGRTLTVSAEYEAESIRSGGVSVEIAWLSADAPQPMKIDKETLPLPAGASSGTLTLEATTPEGAARAWVLLKSLAVGRVSYRSVVCTDDAGRDVTPDPDLDPAKGAWHFIPWSAGHMEDISHGWDRAGEAWIRYEPRQALNSEATYPLAQVHDWLDFRSQAMAEFMEWMAQRIDAADPTKPVVTYLTIGFANPFEWDLAQQMAISLDHIARAGEHESVLGMQLASGEGDYDSITCALDMIRHHGRPMWAVDLLDFTRGVGLGREGLTRLSLSVVQHGGAGIQYYCWHGTPLYNYSELGVDELRRMVDATRRMARRTEGTDLAAGVALVMPRMPLYSDLPEPPNDWADFMGWYKLLVRAGVCPDVYTLEDLAEAELSGYTAVVIPDCAYILPGALKTLREAEAPLISSGRFALLDFTQRSIPQARRPKARRLREPVGAQLLGETFRCPTPTDTPPRLVCREGSPWLTSKAARQATAALRQAGVSVLLEPGEAPVTGAKFVGDGERHVLVLPDVDGTVEAEVGGRSVEVDSEGAWVGLRQP